MALEDEAGVILGTAPYFQLTGELLDFICKWESKSQGGKETPYPVICWAGENLQRYRWLGFPVLAIMQKMAEAADIDIKDDAMLSIAAIAVDDTGKVDDRIETFIGAKFRHHISFNSRVGSTSLLSPAINENWSSGNYRSVMIREIQNEFAGQISHTTHGVGHLNILIDNAIRKYCSDTTPKEELDAVLLWFRDQLPELDPLERPAYLSYGEGNWAKMYQKLVPFFKVYGVYGNPREEELLVRTICGIAHRTYEPGSIMQWMLLLQGQAGCGKTAFGEILALDTAPAVVTSPTEIGKKTTLENIHGASVVVLDEMDVSIGKRDIAENKGFISSTHFSTRKAWRHDSERIPASWVIVGTTNAEALPHDDGAGMRRYGIIRLKGGMEEGEKRAKFLVENRKFIHAVAAHLYFAGYPCDLGAALVKDNSAVSQDFVETPDEAGLLASYLEYLPAILTTESGALLQVTTQTIWQLLTSDSKYHPRRAHAVVHVLENAGWTRRRANGTGRQTFWIPPCFAAKGEDGFELKPFHPDNLHMLRKAVVGLDIKGQIVKDEPVSEPQGPQDGQEQPPKPKPTQLPQERGKQPPQPKEGVSYKFKQEDKEKPDTPAHSAESLIALIEAMGATPPDTTSVPVLSKFLASL